MLFEESFFQKEIRGGFEVSSMMKRCWAAQLEVMERIDEICRSHDIRYYANQGTLLGTVRSHGFIPWDDDIDLCMLRGDFDRFRTEAVEDLKAEGLSLITPFTDHEYNNLAFQVLNNKGICVDKDFLEKYHYFPYYAGVDIELLDDLPDKAEDLELIKTLGFSANYLGQIWKDPEVSREEKEEIYEQLLAITGQKRAEEGSIENQLWQLTDLVFSLWKGSGSSHIAFIAKYLNDPQNFYERDWFDDPVYLDFMGFSMPCPREYDKVLRTEFGDDYMTPKRVPALHEYPYYREWYEVFMRYYREKGLECPEMFREL